MDERDKVKYIYSILSGTIDISGFKFTQPSPHDIYVSEVIYDDIYRKARFCDVLNDLEMVNIMKDRGLWSSNDDRECADLPKQIEQLKVNLYNMYLKLKPLDGIKYNLQKCRERLESLYSRRNMFYLCTAEGIASIARNQYVACTGFNVNYDDIDSGLAMILCEAYVQDILSDIEIRALARTDMWRSMWFVGCSAEQLFGRSTCSLTINQKNIIQWSKFLDNLYENPDRPSDDVIANDDLLDGWLLIEYNKRKEDDKRKRSSGFNNIKDGAEIFIPVADRKGAEAVDALNDPETKFMKDQKIREVNRRGVVKEEETSDARLKMRMQAQQQLIQKIRKK